jgi:diguanylate cyclase
VKTSTDTENWRDKYFASLSSLENEQQQFRAMETTLKRLAGRLCTASLGQSPRLDEQIKKLQLALRRDTSSGDLEKMAPALTEAIQALDQPATSAGTASPVSGAGVAKLPADPSNGSHAMPARDAVVDERVRAILAAVLVELRRDVELVEQAEALDSRLTASLTQPQFPDVLSTLTELVGQRIQRIERAKQEIETLLGHMVEKLDEISRFVAQQHQAQTQSHASSETLNIQLVGEIKAMGESVDSADDLTQIRAQVHRRLDSIDQHLQEFREREATLAAAMRASNERMRARVTELEAEAHRLHGQLKDEQRLSTIDALTKVANRLAYGKRIDEELQRWQRFKQPTCLAVWDVDHFKRINDTYGHRAGDRVLSAVAECLSTRIRSTDFLARYGGEEFVLILPGTKLDDAMRVVDQMRIAISSIGFHFRGTPVSITVSSGVTAFLQPDTTGSIFDRADKALYQAKERGRNRCVSA